MATWKTNSCKFYGFIISIWFFSFVWKWRRGAVNIETKCLFSYVKKVFKLNWVFCSLCWCSFTDLWRLNYFTENYHIFRFGKFKFWNENMVDSVWGKYLVWRFSQFSSIQINWSVPSPINYDFDFCVNDLESRTRKSWLTSIFSVLQAALT